MTTTASRYHDFSAGHRVCEHESKCRHLHGHNYRVHFTVQAEELDALGRVIDFSVIKEKLCAWVEEHWDHKFLAYLNDPVINAMLNAVGDSLKEGFFDDTEADPILQSVVLVPFNPTAENMAEHLLHVVGPEQLKDTGVTLTRVVIEETRKCSAASEL